METAEIDKHCDYMGSCRQPIRLGGNLAVRFYQVMKHDGEQRDQTLESRSMIQLQHQVDALLKQGWTRNGSPSTFHF